MKQFVSVNFKLLDFSDGFISFSCSCDDSLITLLGLVISSSASCSGSTQISLRTSLSKYVFCLIHLDLRLILLVFQFLCVSRCQGSAHRLQILSCVASKSLLRYLFATVDSFEHANPLCLAVSSRHLEESRFIQLLFGWFEGNNDRAALRTVRVLFFKLAVRELTVESVAVQLGVGSFL